MKNIKQLKDSYDRRVTFTNDLAAAKAKAVKIKVANALKALEEHEATRATWARIHRMDGTAQSRKGFYMVVALDEDGVRKERVTREGIEEATLVENKERFTQSLGSPLSASPMLDKLGFLGLGKAAD